MVDEAIMGGHNQNAFCGCRCCRYFRPPPYTKALGRRRRGEKALGLASIGRCLVFSLRLALSLKTKPVGKPGWEDVDPLVPPVHIGSRGGGPTLEVHGGGGSPVYTQVLVPPSVPSISLPPQSLLLSSWAGLRT